jgi:glutaryl-CoA dehydrogenase
MNSQDQYKVRHKVDDFQSPDFYQLDDLLSIDHKLIRQSVRDFVKKEISPIIEDIAQTTRFPISLIAKMGELGVFGPTVPAEFGAMGADYLAYGLMMQELERGDSGIRSMASVQSSLVMYPILAFGSEQQKQTFLPALANGSMLGCFGLTEPDHGSNPSGMTTHFEEHEGHFLLNGSKMWISNAPTADLALVWAKNADGRIKGLLITRGMEGFSTPEIKNKWSLRTSQTGELVFNNVKVPKENLLPYADGLKAPLACLDNARFGIAWGATGAAMDAYETALKYAKERVQFGKPIASFQLVQKKLAEMLTEITKSQLVNWRLALLKDAQKATTEQISMAKRSSVEMALKVVHEARQILGGNGITGEFSVMRHLMNLESVVTYEGTHDIHLLILGNYITGIQSFK